MGARDRAGQPEGTPSGLARLGTPPPCRPPALGERCHKLEIGPEPWEFTPPLEKQEPGLFSNNFLMSAGFFLMGREKSVPLCLLYVHLDGKAGFSSRKGPLSPPVFLRRERPGWETTFSAIK